MLVTFVLFGHWMEMKSRRGTTDVLRALFALVPPTATVIRDGVERDVPTGEIVVGDPLDILRALRLSRATVTKMKQNLIWASIYNLLAIPVAAGVLYPRFGIVLQPEWSALLMSLSSIIVATNAVLLKRIEPALIRAERGR